MRSGYLQALSANGSIKEYEKHRAVAQHVDSLLTFIADMNTQTLQMMTADDFATLKQAIDARLQQVQK